MARSAITDATRRRAVDAAAPAAPRADSTDLGPWRLAGRIAQGEWTDVFAARPANRPQSPACYAIKLPSGSHHDLAQAVDCLRREAAAAHAVRHPHLIQVLAARWRAPPYYLVMPRLPGCSLERARAQRMWSVTMALCLVRQAAEALAALHRGGWRHGDVKPGNIMVSPSGHATLIDLGFAQRNDEDAARRRHERPNPSQPLLGTPAYWAPEVFTSAHAADARSDLYSLGVTLFELLAGRLPFQGESAASLAQQHLTAAPPDLRRLAPHLPGEVVRLVAQLLAKHPLRRPQSAQELIDRLVALEISTFEDRWP